MFSDRPDSPYLASTLLSSGKDDDSPVVRCTKHMCPIRVHWHIKSNYKAYWRVKITITNFNYKMNYSQWNLVVQHPNFENLTQIFSFNYEPLLPYGSISEYSFPLTMKYNLRIHFSCLTDFIFFRWYCYVLGNPILQWSTNAGWTFWKCAIRDHISER